MSNITLSKLDFNLGSVLSKDFEISFSNDNKLSPKSLAYVIRWHRASKRAGSAKVKTMSEISGTTAKPWKQKGTGRARQGSRRSVQFVGGRTCHGPVVRSFGFSAPKQIVKLALADVLRSKLESNKIILFSDGFLKNSTSTVSALLSKAKIDNALIISDKNNASDTFLSRSVRNIKNSKVLDSNAINGYDILAFDYILVNENIFEKKIKRLLAIN